MTKNWRTAEIIIAIVLILWGCFLFFEGVHSIYFVFTLAFQDHILKWEQVSLLKTFHSYYIQVLLPFTAIMGGIFLLRNKKIGWILSLITSLLYTGIFLVPYDNASNYYKDLEFVLIISCIGIFFITISIVLALKPFRNKYKANKINWLIISAVVLLVYADKFLGYLFSLSAAELLKYK